MTASVGFTGKGTVISMSSTSGGTFTPVGQIKTAQFTGQKWSFDDITNLSSPQSGAGVVEEFAVTKLSGGEAAIGGIYLPGDAGQQAMAAAFAAGTLQYFKIQLPIGPGQTTTGNLYSFAAFVQDLPTADIQFDKVLTFKTSLKISGVLTITIGS